MSRITDIAKTMKTWWKEDDDPFVHRALDEIIRIDQEQLPTIEPKHGEWIRISSLYSLDRTYRCSVCGKVIDDMPMDEYYDPAYKGCPYCLTRMKGADDD